MSVSCECCVLSGREVSATSWSLVQRSPTECGVSDVCDHETSKWGALGTRKGAVEKKESSFFYIFRPAELIFRENTNKKEHILDIKYGGFASIQ
jgi:hypothetical protein